MKNYSFERVHGSENGEQVEIQRKKRSFRLGTKVLCLLLAFLFWLIVTNVDNFKNNGGADPADRCGETAGEQE